MRTAHPIFNLKLVLWFVSTCLAASTSFAQIPNHSAGFENASNLEQKARALVRQWNGESINRSIALFLDAADQYGAINSKAQASLCLREAAAAQVLINKKTEALETLLNASKIDKESNSAADEIKTRSHLAIVYLRLGELKKSQQQAESAANLTLSVSDPSAHASVRFALAEIAYEKNEIESSIQNYEYAVKIWQEQGNTKEQAQTLRALAYAYLAYSEYSTALRKSEESLEKSREIGDVREQTLAHVAVGQMKFRLDDNQAALGYFQTAEDLFPDDVDLMEKAVLYNGMAGVYENFGAWQLSLIFREKAFELFQKESNLFAQLATLPSLGKASYRLKNEKAAQLYFNQGLSLAAKMNDKLFPSVIFEEMGNMYFESSDDKQAVRYYAKASKGLAQFGFKRSVAVIQAQIGRIHQRQGNLTLARQYYDASLKTSREIKVKFAQANALFYLARLDALERKTETALERIEESLRITEFLYTDIANQNLRISYFSDVFERYELYINLLMNLHKQFPKEKYAARALQIAEKARARSLLENLALSEGGYTKHADVEAVKREKEIRVLLNIKADQLTDLLSRSADSAITKKIEDELSELEHELEEIKAGLKHSSPIYSAIKNPAAFDVTKLQSDILDENSLLLEFSFGESESYLWTISKSEVNSYVLPPRKRIEAQIDVLRLLLDSREKDKNEPLENYRKRVVDAENNYSIEARNLSDLLFGMIADKIQNKRLIIVPDGKLHYFPVSALPIPESGTNEPILLTNEIVYEASAQTLLILAKGRSQSLQAPKDLLVFSDPVFSGDDSRLSVERNSTDEADSDSAHDGAFRFAESLNSLPRLNASKDESDSIMDIVGSSKSDAFTGFSASREQLLNARVSDYKIIHFATHGLIDEERPELSGIVLSRFNEKGQKVNEFVRLQDIYGLNFSADLVILSACRTGIGKEVKGEGLISLNHAFLQSGAKSVVASLWKVDDYATVELMRNFYRELADGRATPAQALRAAQINLRHNPIYRSPFYWASFTVHGDFRHAPDVTRKFDRSFYRFLIAIVFLPIFFFGIYRLIRFYIGFKSN